MVTDTALPKTPLTAFATHPMVAVDPSATLRDAARAMREHDVSCVLVRDDAGYTVCTERDITDAVANGRSPRTLATVVHDAMPRTVAAEATLQDAAVLMVHFGVRHLVVVQAGEPVGVVSIRDVVRELARTASPSLAAALHAALTTRPDCWLG